MPWLDPFIAKNPVLTMFMATQPIVKFTVDQMNARLNSKGGENPDRKDFLARSFEAQQKSPHLVTDRIIQMWNIDNVFAGSNTMAISLRSVSQNVLVI